MLVPIKYNKKYIEKQIIVKLHKNFEDCAHEKDGVEFWYARELQELLGYNEWRNFEGVIKKAKIACETAKQKDSNHFVGVNKMIDIGKGGQREVSDVMLIKQKIWQMRLQVLM